MQRDWDSPMIILKQVPHIFRGEPAACEPIESSLYNEF